MAAVCEPTRSYLAVVPVADRLRIYGRERSTDTAYPTATR
jgi:hypothetical protein